MITNFEALFLGAIQGLTEFLPISSSGHLILAQEIIGVKQIGNELEVLVHMGTLISIIIIYRKDIQLLLFSIKRKKYSVLFSLYNYRFVSCCFLWFDVKRHNFSVI